MLVPQAIDKEPVKGILLATTAVTWTGVDVPLAPEQVTIHWYQVVADTVAV